jgi:acyl-CoA reductase-like NAD-dependent aldehyde dehydrogenase
VVLLQKPEPFGVALIISPWNYPMSLLLEPMAAAYAAGNVVVCKPSEVSENSTRAMAELLPKYLLANKAKSPFRPLFQFPVAAVCLTVVARLL